MPTVVIALVTWAVSPCEAGDYVLRVRGDQLLLNEKPFKIIGLRCSNALMTDQTTDDLIDHLPVYRKYGVNTVSVYFMGSRFGDVKGYRPDATLDPIYAARMGKIIEAADNQGMVVVVGCLYWSESRAKEDLVATWKQKDATRAVANTVRWLKEHDHRNVFVDPDNEGMAHDARQWSIAEMISSTWLQCAPGEGVGGPFFKPGGRSRITDVDADIDRLHEDAGIAWWLDFVKKEYGPWRSGEQ